MLNGYIAFIKKSKQGENEPGANYRVREDADLYEIEPSEDSDNLDDATL